MVCSICIVVCVVPMAWALILESFKFNLNPLLALEGETRAKGVREVDQGRL